jgi:hypothetical protein
MIGGHQVVVVQPGIVISGFQRVNRQRVEDAGGDMSYQCHHDHHEHHSMSGGAL